jgi:hypothetical protein
MELAFGKYLHAFELQTETDKSNDICTSVLASMDLPAVRPECNQALDST